MACITGSHPASTHPSPRTHSPHHLQHMQKFAKFAKSPASPTSSPNAIIAKTPALFRPFTAQTTQHQLCPEFSFSKCINLQPQAGLSLSKAIPPNATPPPRTPTENGIRAPNATISPSSAPFAEIATTATTPENPTHRPTGLPGHDRKACDQRSILSRFRIINRLTG